MNCKYCNAELPEKVTLCPVCGKEQEVVEETTAVEETAVEETTIEEVAAEEGKEISEIRGEELSKLWQKAKEKANIKRG